MEDCLSTPIILSILLILSKKAQNALHEYTGKLVHVHYQSLRVLVVLRYVNSRSTASAVQLPPRTAASCAAASRASRPR